jgi:signal peptidase
MGKEPKWLKRYHVITKIIGLILIIISLLIIVINITMTISANKNKDKLPSFLGYKQVIITGKSMLPSIEAGDVIIAKEEENLKEQDIIIFMDKNNSIVTHRIVEIKEQEEEIIYITQGDANNSTDDPITKSQIQGKMIFQFNGWGKTIAFLRSTVGLIFLIGIPVVYASITRYLSIQFYKKQMERKQERIAYTNSKTQI